MLRWLVAFAAFFIFFNNLSANAQGLDKNQGPIEVTEPAPSYPAKGEKPAPRTSPTVGRKAAERYMAPKAAEPARRESASGPDAHYLAIHVGSFISDNAYTWGGSDQTNVGRWNMGVTYRTGEWVNSADAGIRVEFDNYALSEGRAAKLSFEGVLMFPDASSKFPLYFGIGAGPGVFVTQITNKSSVSLDYQIFAGVRFFDLVNNTGAFVEAGMKNHFLFLSSGQFNGTYAAVGLVFSF